MKRKLFAVITLALISITSLNGCSKKNDDETSDTTVAELTYHQKFNKPAEDNILDDMLDLLKLSGKTFISSTVSGLIKAGFTSILTELGFDMRSVEERELDEINETVLQIQQSVNAGFSNIMRKQVKIHNEDLFKALLDEVDDVRSPIIAEMATLTEITRKEITNEADEATLDNEKQELAKELLNLSFPRLGGNEIWYCCEKLANDLMMPNSANPSLKLFDLYEENFGALETWDYMTIKPRTKFITYLSYIVNSMCELAKLAASYKISQMPDGSSGIKGVETAIGNMVTAVNSLNEQFQTELNNLNQIKIDHDDNHLMTHRDRIIDSEGNITMQKGQTVSTRLMPVTTGNNEYNYTLYSHNQGITRDNRPDDLYYESYVYTLQCGDDTTSLYRTILSEYCAYNASLGYTDRKEFTIKDYLIAIGFECHELNLFEQAKGFYWSVKCISISGYGGYLNLITSLCTLYYSFTSCDGNGDLDIFDSVQEYKSWIFGSTQWNVTRYDCVDNYYLCFVNADQRTLYGDVKLETVSYTVYEDRASNNFNKHYKGYGTWTKDKGTVNYLLDSHL